MISPTNNDEEEGESACGGTNWETYQENTNIKGKKGPKDVAMDENGLRQVQMGEASWFGRTFQNLVDYTMRRHVKRILTNLRDRRWLYQTSSSWQKNSYWPRIYLWSTWHFQWWSYGCYQCYYSRWKYCFEENCKPQCICRKWIVKCHMHEKGISSQICSHFANHLSTKVVSLL